MTLLVFKEFPVCTKTHTTIGDCIHRINIDNIDINFTTAKYLLHLVPHII